MSENGNESNNNLNSMFNNSNNSTNANPINIEKKKSYKTCLAQLSSLVGEFKEGHGNLYKENNIVVIKLITKLGKDITDLNKDIKSGKNLLTMTKYKETNRNNLKIYLEKYIEFFKNFKHFRDIYETYYGSNSVIMNNCIEKFNNLKTEIITKPSIERQGFLDKFTEYMKLYTEKSTKFSKALTRFEALNEQYLTDYQQFIINKSKEFVEKIETYIYKYYSLYVKTFDKLDEIQNALYMNELNTGNNKYEFKTSVINNYKRKLENRSNEITSKSIGNLIKNLKNTKIQITNNYNNNIKTVSMFSEILSDNSSTFNESTQIQKMEMDTSIANSLKNKDSELELDFSLLDKFFEKYYKLLDKRIQGIKESFEEYKKLCELLKKLLEKTANSKEKATLNENGLQKIQTKVNDLLKTYENLKSQYDNCVVTANNFNKLRPGTDLSGIGLDAIQSMVSPLATTEQTAPSTAPINKNKQNEIKFTNDRNKAEFIFKHLFNSNERVSSLKYLNNEGKLQSLLVQIDPKVSRGTHPVNQLHSNVNGLFNSDGSIINNNPKIRILIIEHVIESIKNKKSAKISQNTNQHPTNANGFNTNISKNIPLNNKNKYAFDHKQDLIDYLNEKKNLQEKLK